MDRSRTIEVILIIPAMILLLTYVYFGSGSIPEENTPPYQPLSDQEYVDSLIRESGLEVTLPKVEGTGLDSIPRHDEAVVIGWLRDSTAVETYGDQPFVYWNGMLMPFVDFEKHISGFRGKSVVVMIDSKVNGDTYKKFGKPKACERIQYYFVVSKSNSIMACSVFMRQVEIVEWDKAHLFYMPPTQIMVFVNSRNQVLLEDSRVADLKEVSETSFAYHTEVRGFDSFIDYTGFIDSKTVSERLKRLKRNGDSSLITKEKWSKWDSIVDRLGEVPRINPILLIDSQNGTNFNAFINIVSLYLKGKQNAIQYWRDKLLPKDATSKQKDAFQIWQKMNIPFKWSAHFFEYEFEDCENCTPRFLKPNKIILYSWLPPPPPSQ